MTCRLPSTKPLSETMLAYCQLGTYRQTSVKLGPKYNNFFSRKCSGKWRLSNGVQILSHTQCGKPLTLPPKKSAHGLHWSCLVVGWYWVGVTNSIMMLMKFFNLSQSDRSNWVMWQVGDAFPRPGWDRCLTWENGFHKKCKKLDNIAVYLTAHLE